MSQRSVTGSTGAAARGRLCATKARKGGRKGRLKQPCCTRDEGGPLGLGLQGQGPNRLELLWPNGQGGERSGKGGITRQVGTGKTNASEPLRKCRKRRDVIETGLQLLARDEARGMPADCPSGDRHKDGVSPVQALVENVGTCVSMPRETSKWSTHEEPSTDARRRGGRARSSAEAW